MDAEDYFAEFAPTPPDGEWDVQILSTRALTPPPRSREHNDFLPWSPDLVVLMSERASPQGTLESATTTPVRQIRPPVYQVDTPSPLVSLDFTDLAV